MIDITMTSVIRIDILEQTLSSFCNNIFIDKNRYRLIINIDPIGDNIRRKFVIKTVKKYFNNVVFNLPEVPGFCNAVIWCWSQTESDFVFHLEDDWKLIKKINIDSMIEIFNKEENKNLVSLRLDKEDHHPSKHGNKYGFVYSPKLSLNPSLLRGEFVRNVYKLMNPLKNPEKQIRPTDKNELGRFLLPLRYGIYTKDCYGKVVVDIGREWLKNSRYNRPIGFTSWEEKE